VRASNRTRKALCSGALCTLLALVGCNRAAPPEPVTTDVSSLEPDVARVVEKQLATVRLDPASARAHGVLAMAYEANGLWEEAERSYANAARLAPDYVLWTFRRAIALEEIGETELSLALLREAAGGATSEAAPHHRLASALLRDGDLDRAEAEFLTAKRLGRGLPHPELGLAQVALERGDFEAARGLLAPVLAANPGYGHAHYLNGQALRGLGRMDEAAQELRLGLDSRPDAMPDPLTVETRALGVSFYDRMARGVTLLEEGRVNDGVRVLETLYATRPNDDRVLNNLAAGYIDQGQHQKGLELLTRLVELKPNEFPAFINLASCALRLGKPDDALRYSDRAVELAPEQARAHYGRAEALAAQGALQEAFRALKKTVSLDPSFVPGHLALGEVAMRTKNTPQAIQSYKEGLALDPENLLAMINLSSLLLRSGRLPEAETTLQRAEALAPGEPRVRELRQALNKAR